MRDVIAAEMSGGWHLVAFFTRWRAGLTRRLRLGGGVRRLSGPDGLHPPPGAEVDRLARRVSEAPDLAPPAGAHNHRDAPERLVRIGFLAGLLGAARVEDAELRVVVVRGALRLRRDRVERLAKRRLRHLVREAVATRVVDARDDADGR